MAGTSPITTLSKNVRQSCSRLCFREGRWSLLRSLWALRFQADLFLRLGSTFLPSVKPAVSHSQWRWSMLWRSILTKINIDEAQCSPAPWPVFHFLNDEHQCRWSTVLMNINADEGQYSWVSMPMKTITHEHQCRRRPILTNINVDEGQYWWTSILMKENTDEHQYRWRRILTNINTDEGQYWRTSILIKENTDEHQYRWRTILTKID